MVKVKYNVDRRSATMCQFYFGQIVAQIIELW